MKIGEAYIKRIGGKSRCCSNISWGDRSRTLWFEVEREYEECLCTERIDGFLVALLPFAMIGNLNIHSEGYISERLFYQFKTILLPSLSANITEFNSIDIDARFDGMVLESKNGVGTALSCGVDSFYTVLKHINTEMEGFNLTHLTYFNIMNHTQWKGYGENSSRDFSNARIDYIKPAVKELGLKLVAVDSNFDLFYHDYSYLGTFTFRFLGAVLALQKLFGKYYWSSSSPFSQFAFTFNDTSLFDLLSVQCVSNQNTTFYSTGSEINRLEKTAYISNFAVTYKYLNTCWINLYNCTNQCDKCKRTILALYALGKLDFYSEVFDVKKFYQSIDEYLGYMLFKCVTDKHHSFYKEIYDCLVGQHIKIPQKAKMYAIKLLVEAIKKRAKEII
ncbi:MAG TPA: hypothetical protein PKH16_16150 [Aequorivita sp.]|nr:hypothetical protein [Aequorivita sp.]